MQVLKTDIPLQILVDNVKSDSFWKRCYYSKWSEYSLDENNKPWINIFMERHYADILENMNPRQYDPEKVILLILYLKLSSINVYLHLDHFQFNYVELFLSVKSYLF